MQSTESLKLAGNLHIVLVDEHGVVKEERYEKNLIVNVGKAFITSRMIGTSSAVMSHMEVGTDNTGAAGANTALGAPVSASRTALTSSTQSTVTTTNDSITFACTFGPGVGTGALTEAGIFNNSSGGTMLCRTVFSVITKGAGDTLTINWTITGS
jgi:hypothetical protein